MSPWVAKLIEYLPTKLTRERPSTAEVISGTVSPQKIFRRLCWELNDLKDILEQEPEPQKNVFGEALSPCSESPITGFFRDGCCNTGPMDFGSHTVCAVMTSEFLAFSKKAGNDLSTPVPEYGFPGLKAGDRWCLCAARWQQAFEAGMAPKVALSATHESALEIISLQDLKRFAIDLS